MKTLEAVAINEEKNAFCFDAQASDLPESKSLFNLNTEYEIRSFINMESKTGYTVQYDIAEYKSFKTDLEEYDVTKDSVEVAGIQQIDGNSIYVDFDDSVFLSPDITSDKIITSSGVKYDFIIDNDYRGDGKIELRLASGTFTHKTENIKFDFTNYLVDVLKRPVYMGSTGKASIFVNYVDFVEPVISSPFAINNELLVTTADEELSYGGSWILKNENGKIYDTLNTLLNGSMIMFVLENRVLQDNVSYTLSMLAAPRDLAGNSSKKDSWTVTGKGTEPIPFTAELKILNSKTAKVTGDNVDEDLSPNNVILLIDGNEVSNDKYFVSEYDNLVDGMMITLKGDLSFENGSKYDVKLNDGKTGLVQGPPSTEITSIQAVDEDTIKVIFTDKNGSINEESAETLTNYFIDGIGHPKKLI